MMQIPIAVGLFVKARDYSTAESQHPHMSLFSTGALVLLMVSALVLNFSELVGAVGTGARITILVFLIVVIVLFYILMGPEDQAAFTEEFMTRFLSGYRVEIHLEEKWLI
jgi:predicted Na+-dependent transporter